MDDLAKGSTYDLILLDYDMPGENGLNGLKRLKQEFPDQTYGMISGITDTLIIKECLEFGAIGWIPKSMSGDPLIHAIRIMAENVQFVPADIILKLEQTEDRWHLFTGIEKDIAKLITTGQSDKEIAGSLNMPVRTVQHHVRSILKKADSENRIKFALSFAL